MTEPSELQYSIGISPPVYFGKLNVELDYRSLNYQEDSIIERLHFGAIYQMGAMSLTGGVDYNGISGGIFFGLKEINAGIVYSTTNVVA